MQTFFRPLTCLKLLSVNSRALAYNRQFHIASFQKAARKEKQDSSLAENNQRIQSDQLSLRGKVKETSKTVWYSSVVIAGIAATGFILFTILRELFSTQSPQAVYSKSLKKCCEHPRVCDLLGEPIIGFGEENSRGRRKRLRHSFHFKDGIEHMQMKFYIKGIRNSATVFVDMVKINDSFEYSYLMVEVENYSKERVFVIDNREFQTVY